MSESISKSNQMSRSLIKPRLLDQEDLNKNSLDTHISNKNISGSRSKPQASLFMSKRIV